MTKRILFLLYIIFCSGVIVLGFDFIKKNHIGNSSNIAEIDSIKIKETISILKFIAGKENLPDRLRMELHIRLLYRMLSQLHGEDSLKNISLTRADSLEVVILKNKIKSYNLSAENLKRYKNSFDYTDDIINCYYIYSRVCYSDSTTNKDLLLFKYLKMKKVLDINKFDIRNLEGNKNIWIKAIEKLEVDEKYFGNDSSAKKYEALSHMHQKYGSPLIVLFSNEYTHQLWYGTRSMYNGNKNTIELGVFDFEKFNLYTEHFFAELAHAYMHQKLYIPEVMNNRYKDQEEYADSISQIHFKFYQIDLPDNSNRYRPPLIGKNILYETKDVIHGYYSTEYEAHKIIEPEFINEYNLLVSKGEREVLKFEKYQ